MAPDPWPTSPPPPAAISNGTSHFWFAVGLLAVVFKLWLTRAQQMAVVSWAVHDEIFFLSRAHDLLQGQWLGDYDQLTLIKGIGYPLWIASCYRLGLPLMLAQQLLYAAACVVFTQAVRPLLPRTDVRGLLFLLLLFSPASFGLLRVLREGIYSSLTLLVVAGGVGLALRANGPLAAMGRYALVFGLALPALWLTREEGIWLLPSCLLFGGLAARRAWACPQRRQRLALCLLPWGIMLVLVLLVALENGRRYGVFATTEMSARPFKRAYGALVRVTHAQFHPMLPVPKETRLRIYAVSPAFAELQPLLEGRLGQLWSRTDALAGISPERGEIAGSCFLWALRDAVHRAGHAETGAAAMAFYQRLADEVNQACDRGDLACGPPHASLAPPWRREYAPLVAAAAIRIVQALLNCESLYLSLPSQGRRSRLAETLTRETPAPSLEPNGPYPPAPPGTRETIREWRLAMIAGIVNLYRVLLPPLCILAALAFLGTLAVAPRGPYAIIGAGLFIAMGFRVLILSYFDVTSFPGSIPSYVSPIQALLPAFVVLSLAPAIHWARNRGGTARLKTDSR